MKTWQTVHDKGPNFEPLPSEHHVSDKCRRSRIAKLIDSTGSKSVGHSVCAFFCAACVEILSSSQVQEILVSYLQEKNKLVLYSLLCSISGSVTDNESKQGLGQRCRHLVTIYPRLDRHHALPLKARFLALIKPFLFHSSGLYASYDGALPLIAQS